MDVTTQYMLETIEEGLNEVFYDSYNMEVLPDYARIEDIFKVEPANKKTEYDLEMRGVGRFRQKGESSDIAEDDIEEKYKTSYTAVDFANSVPVSFTYMQDDLYNVVKENIGELGDAGRDTRYNSGFSIFNNAFNSSFVGADGKPLCADDHDRDLGGVLDNKETDKLSSETLRVMIKKLAEQKALSGIMVTNVPYCLLVPPNLYELAVKITEAKLEHNTANNAPNVWSTKYGIMVKQSPYISAANGGSDDAFFLLGKRHKIKNFVRQDMMTWMTPWNISRKMTSYYNAFYRESFGWSSPIGIVGSNGTTGSYPTS